MHLMTHFSVFHFANSKLKMEMCMEKSIFVLIPMQTNQLNLKLSFALQITYFSFSYLCIFWLHTMKTVHFPLFRGRYFERGIMENGHFSIFPFHMTILNIILTKNTWIVSASAQQLLLSKSEENVIVVSSIFACWQYLFQ